MQNNYVKLAAFDPPGINNETCSNPDDTSVACETESNPPAESPNAPSGGGGDNYAPDADTPEGGHKGEDEPDGDDLGCAFEQSKEARIDAEARRTAATIRALNNMQDNPGNHEFGTFVLRLNNGRIVSAFPTEGNTGGVSLRTMLADARAEFGNNISVNNIVGIVHSHPSEAGPGFVNASSLNDLSPLDYGSTMPSHPNLGTRTDPMTGREILTDWPGGEHSWLTAGTPILTLFHTIYIYSGLMAC